VRRVLLASLLVLGSAGAIAGMDASPAGACSCAVPDSNSFARADAAFIGTLNDTVPRVALGDVASTVPSADYHFAVEQVVKGDLPTDITVVAPSGGASCGIEAADGSPTGLLLIAGTADTWESSLCSQLAPEELLAFSGGDTNPPTPGDDPVSPEEDGGNSHGFAIVLFVVYVAAAVGVGYVLVRNPSRSDGSAPDAA
jgi:hypothetical protein